MHLPDDDVEIIGLSMRIAASSIRGSNWTRPPLRATTSKRPSPTPATPSLRPPVRGVSVVEASRMSRRRPTLGADSGARWCRANRSGPFHRAGRASCGERGCVARPRSTDGGDADSGGAPRVTAPRRPRMTSNSFGRELARRHTVTATLMLRLQEHRRISQSVKPNCCLLGRDKYVAAAANCTGLQFPNFA